MRAIGRAVSQLGRRPTDGAVRLALSACLGGLAVVSVLFDGFYSSRVWEPLALGILLVLIAAATGGKIALSRAGAVALAGLALLAGWSALSATWAESVGRAWTETNLLGLYAATLLLALSVIRTRSAARVAVGAFGAGVLALGLYVVTRMLAGSGSDLFVAFRLHEPLGYINGQAGLFLMGMWALLAGAERAPRAAYRGAALAGAVLLAGLVVLTQSRAPLPMFVVSVAVVMAVLPGRVRRGWMLLLAALAVAIAVPDLLDVYEQNSRTDAELPTTNVVRPAAGAALLSAAAAGLAWGLASWGRLRAAVRLDGNAPKWALIGSAAVALVLLVGVVGSPADEIRSRWDAFASLNPGSANQQRFTSPDGFRYDLWRVALNQFADDPLQGTGSGNFVSTYYQDRRTNESVRQPHSLGLQLLAELGVMGALGLAIFIGGATAGAIRWRSAARSGGPGVGVPVAALGMFTVWLAYTSVDWLHLIPGVTIPALVAVAALTADGDAINARGGRRLVLPILTLLAAGVLAMSLARHHGAAMYLERARTEVVTDPASATADARRSLALNEHEIGGYTLLAAAQSRQGKYAQARATLLAAAAQEPFNHLPWVLSGDLATRRGDRAQARRDYARARALNRRLELKP